MRFVSFENQGKPTYGLWQDEGSWLQVPAGFEARYPDLKSVIAAGKLDELEAETRAHGSLKSAATTTLLPVIPHPGKIFCVGLNYKSHVAETKRADSQFPSIFTRFADTLSAHNAGTSTAKGKVSLCGGGFWPPHLDRTTAIKTLVKAP